MNCAKDMTGQRCGMLTVVHYAQSEHAGAHWLCRCDCGKERVVSGKNLRKGQYSCGCTALAKRTHGMARTGTYQCWVDMRRRCSDPGRKAFKDYGARGISICDRWSAFENFLADMGAAPSGMTIERKDNSKGYEPGNCCWATKTEQSQNRRSVRYVDLNGERVCAAEAARRTGIKHTTIIYRLDAGWPMHRVLESGSR